MTSSGLFGSVLISSDSVRYQGFGTELLMIHKVRFTDLS